jgi:hypothetical protein
VIVSTRIIDAPLELPRDAGKVPVHRGARALGVARCDRGCDGGVVA